MSPRVTRTLWLACLSLAACVLSSACETDSSAPVNGDATDTAAPPAEVDGDVNAEVFEDARPTEADTTAPDAEADDAEADATTPDAEADQICPVVGYEACGGDVLGTWAFMDLCPEDPEAAAALCENPFDDRPACVDGGNVNRCEGYQSGTLTFDGAGVVTVDTESGMDVSWIFTDACLEAAQQGGATPEARCLGMNTDKLSCTYEPDACACVGLVSMTQSDFNEAPYAIEGDEIVLGEDPPATYCVDGDRLIMDYYLFHPVSWRYWVLERQ